MIDELPDVPPAVLLLLSALAESEDWVDTRKRIKSILKDLRDQSITYLSGDDGQAPKKTNPFNFEVHLHGGLDLFNPYGSCSDLRCRATAADKITRSMGLIADRIWLTDLLSEKFVDFGRATNEKLDKIVADTWVLAHLAPLIFAGIVRFRSPWRPVCNDCISHFEENVEAIAREITSKFAREAKFLYRKNGHYSLDTGKFFEPPMLFRSIEPEARLPKLRDATEAIAYRQIRTALWISRDASMYGGSIFSNSRIGLAGLLHQEGRFSDKKGLMLLDRERSIEIPWVSELNAAQILELRQEASNALPLFREKIAKALSADEESSVSTNTSTAFIQELREQAEEVRSELKITQKSSARFWKTTFGLLGLGLSAYGVATDQVVAGVGGLLPLINLLISHAAGHEKEVERLTHRPGYVLVKAQDILAHEH